MRVVLQRVKHAEVFVEGKQVGKIGRGLLVFAGFEENDRQDDIDWLTYKILQLRIFEDLDGKMNWSVMDIKGSLLIISQFTLFASTKKGNRPSFIRSAPPSIAVPLYESFLASCKQRISTESGVFGADMSVSLVNDGPVTICIDSKMKE